MNLYSWNVNGIRSAANKGLVDWFMQTQPDILCLQETKAHPEQVPPGLANPVGYHCYWNPARRRGYSGVAVFSRKKPAAAGYGLGIEIFDQEGRVIELQYEQFTLLNIYFPNGQRDHGRVPFKLDFCEAVLARCETLRKSGQKVIVCGDFNTAHREIDLRNPKTNRDTSGFLPEERAWIDRFIAHGYIDTFRVFNREGGNYSWWSYRFSARERNIGWRIDYFFVSPDLAGELEDAFILPEVPGSDHCPVGISLTDR
jgi:exodeoxyribonuclease-3